MLTSPFDKRVYKTLTLKCGLTALVVQDPQCQKSAVATTIAAGHFQDPPTCQGLAHLLEHMLFLGSKPFPEPNHANEFLSKHGGSINAWTAGEHTNFHFDVEDEALDDALSHYVAMLSQPRFEPELIDKEIHSIDAEFNLKLKDDLRRLYQVHKETCNPAHPFSKFSVGNEEIFRAFSIDELSHMLQQQHQTYYVAANMRLCIISAMPVEHTASLVTHHFAALSSAPAPDNSISEQLYLPQHLSVQLAIKPIKQARRLIISFALPNTEPFYRSKPISLLSYIIGDESSGSLLACLKEKDWVTSLGAGGGIHGSNFKDFNVNMQLTEKGSKHVDDIIETLFYLLGLLDQRIEHEFWRFEEKATLAQQAFDYGDAVKPMELAIEWSNTMFTVATEHVVAFDYMLDQPSSDIIRQCLSYMTPENMRVKVIDHEIETDTIARWYHTPYKITPLSAESIERFKSPRKEDCIDLPEPNPYIISRITPHPIEPEFITPQKILSDSGVACWFAQDDKFHQPKGDCYVSFDCAASFDGIAVAASKRLWISAMMEQLNADYYQAGVAGLHFRIYPHQAGFSVHTNGFSDKQLTLFYQLFGQLHTPFNLEPYFERVKARQLQSLHNSLLNKPINRLFSRLSVLLQRFAYKPDDMLETVSQTTLEDTLSVRETLLREVFIEALLHGDFSSAEASRFSEQLKHNSPARSAGKKLSRDVIDLRAQGRLCHEVVTEENEAAAVIYFQSPDCSPACVAMTILVEQIIAAPFFNYMRTQRQLGYMVGTGYMPYNQHPGMALYIQSPNADAEQLVAEMDNFLVEQFNHLKEIEPYFNQIKTSVMKQLKEKDSNLSMKSQRIWMAIGNDDINFNHKKQVIESIRNLTFTQLTGFFEHIIQRQGFGEMIVFSGKSADSKFDAGGRIITDVEGFKQQSPFTI